jgi:hypothetical protein
MNFDINKFTIKAQEPYKAQSKQRKFQQPILDRTFACCPSRRKRECSGEYYTEIRCQFRQNRIKVTELLERLPKVSVRGMGTSKCRRHLRSFLIFPQQRQKI